MITKALAVRVIAALYEYADELHDGAGRCVDNDDAKQADWYWSQVWEVLEEAEELDEAVKEYDSGRQ